MSGEMSPLDFLFANERTMILADAAGVVSDPQLGQAITYRSYQGRSFVPSTGLWTSTFSEIAIRAIRHTMSAEELELSGGQYQGDDIRYLIAQAHIPEPQDEDQVIATDGSVYRMVGWDTDPLDAFWAVTVRLVKA